MHRLSFVLTLSSLAALWSLGCSTPPGASEPDGGAADTGSTADTGGRDGGPGSDAAPPGDGSIASDAWMPVDAPLALGAACTSATECVSGFCTDGVCCESACEGVCRACDQASTGAPDGRCNAVLAIDPQDECDASGCLTGACSSSGCEVQAAGFECRAVAGDCDVPEVCDGVDAACPADGVRAAETVCRASVGLCDPVEECDGVAATCPGDTYASATTPCRPSAGTCDVTEVCSGADPQCPADAFQPPSAMLCGAYTCSGASCRTSCSTQTDCYGNYLCLTGACVPGYRMFVTAQRYLPTFGSAAGADALCVAAASAAGLGPNFRAWISDATTSASARLYHSPSPYYRLDGTTPRIIANDWTDLVDGISVAIATDEHGNPQRDEYVWTGTLDNGTRSNADCAGWTSTGTTATSGNASAAAFSTYYGLQSCARAHHLYCVEQPPPG